MKSLVTTGKVLCGTFLTFLMTTSLQANTIVVPVGGDIQAAIDAVSVGGTVKIEEGTFPLTQQLVINKNLTLVGAGIDMTIIQSPDTVDLTSTFNYTGASARTFTPVVMVQDASAVAIKHLTVDGRDQSVFGTVQHFTGIGYHNASGEVSQVHVLNILESTEPTGYQEGTAILAANDTGTNTVSVLGTVTDHFQKQGILMIGTGLTVTCKNNTVMGTNVEANPNGIELFDGSTGVISNNIVTNLTNPSSQECSGILIFDAPGVKVENNQVMVNDTGIYLNNCSNSIVNYNNVQNNTVGIEIDETSSTAVNSYTITGNTMQNDPGMSSTFGLVLTSPQSTDLVSPLVTTHSNTIDNPGVGLYVQGSPDGSAGPQVSMHGDVFLGSSQYYVQLVSSPVDIWPTTKSVSFNGLRWSNMTREQFEELVLDPATQQIIDKNTNPSLGLVLTSRT